MFRLLRPLRRVQVLAHPSPPNSPRTLAPTW